MIHTSLITAGSLQNVLFYIILKCVALVLVLCMKQLFYENTHFPNGRNATHSYILDNENYTTYVSIISRSCCEVCYLGFRFLYLYQFLTFLFTHMHFPFRCFHVLIICPCLSESLSPAEADALALLYRQQL